MRPSQHPMRGSMTRMVVVAFLAVFIMAPLHAADPEKARVVTFKSNPVECLASVAITQIDGRNRMVPPGGFEIDPGEHSMHGRATVDLRNCPPARTDSRNPVHIPPLEWFFEPGKVYYVGLDYSSPLRENWRLVVWKAEYENGEVIFDRTEDEADSTP